MKRCVEAAVLILLMLVFYGCLSSLVYHPDKEISFTPQELGLEHEDLYMASADGKMINAWFFPCENARAVVLFCHGNAGNISDRVSQAWMFHKLELSTLLFDYQGFGQSQGRPSEQGTFDDARAAWNYLVQEKGFPPDRIIVFGKSLGGAVAIELATQIEPGLLFVDSSFTSTKDVAKAHYPWAPGFLLHRWKYDSLSRIPKVQAPVCFFHSKRDEVIPFKQGKALFDAAPEPKAFVEITGSHNDGFMTSGRLYTDAVDSFIKMHMEKNES